MDSTASFEQPVSAAPVDFLSGGGEMGEIMRSFDWSRSPLGDPEQWSQPLKTSLSICLNSRFPIIIWWGPELAVLYNDDYIPMLGAKHPDRALGLAGEQVWREVWPTVGPLLDRVMQQGEANWADDLQLFINRGGYLEECYFRFSYSPIRDENGGIGGVFTPVSETTAKVIAERRLRTLRELAEGASRARSSGEACSAAVAVLMAHTYDVPSAALYVVADRQQAHLTAASSPDPPFPKSISLADDKSLFGNAARNAKLSVLSSVPGLAEMRSGPWNEPSPALVFVPVCLPGQNQPPAFLIAGVSARRELDLDYRNFFEMAGQQVGTAIANAQAHEQERRRAEALAEIDRAKTAFFSNVSHEFRTPLTLLLGPLADELAEGAVSGATRERLELAHRNGLRLQKLVNALLDFSRIEADRIPALYEPTDLAVFTAELAPFPNLALDRSSLALARMRSHAADALRESEERYRLLAESVPQLVWSCDANGQCDYLSSQWGAYTGIPEADQLGYAWLQVVHPEDRERAFEIWREAVEGRGEYDLDYRIRRYDGEYRWFKTRGRLLRSAMGGISKWIGTCTDVDDQVRAERELRRANQDLEQFAYSASHDLREPIRNVTLYSQLLQRRYSGKLDSDGEQCLDHVIEGSKRINLLVDDLLAYAKAAIENDRKDEDEVSDANAVLKDALSILSVSIQENDAAITSQPLPTIRIKQAPLEQLFQNLVGNAIKYRKDDEPPRVDVSASRDGAHWRFAVKDNGIGIDPRYQTLIFGLFKRLHGRGKYGGTGLGLAICQKIVDRYGGRIWVESQPGEGAIFYFTLPAIKGEG